MPESDSALREVLTHAEGPRQLDAVMAERLVEVAYAAVTAGQPAPVPSAGLRSWLVRSMAVAAAVSAVAATVGLLTTDAPGRQPRSTALPALSTAPAGGGTRPSAPMRRRSQPPTGTMPRASAPALPAIQHNDTAQTPPPAAPPIAGSGQIDQISGPLAGPLMGGGTLTLHGEGLDGLGAVLFGDTTARFVIDDTATATVTVPSADHAGLVAISATDRHGGAMTGLRVYFSYQDPPTVTGLSSGQGLSQGGQWITVYGSALSTASSVRFGSTVASQMKPVNQTALQVLVPAGSGTVDVTVVSPGGESATSSADRYTYL